jgi:Asp-tRNA(Asn)/Glu-tRNA(Gln) amidotransferase A subunit family amidase
MARTARDLRLLFSALASFDAQDPLSVPVPLAATRSLSAPGSQPARIGVWEQFYQAPVHAAIRAAVRKAAGMLAGLGLTVDDFQPAGLERAPNVWGFLFAQWPQIATRKMLEGREEELHWTLRESLTQDQPTAEQVLLNLAARDRMRASLLRQMEDISAVLMPVCGVPAFAHRQRKWEIDGKSIGLFQAMMPAVLANVLGLPAVTIPVTLTDEDLPVGVQLVGRPYEDELLLDLAVRLEEARGPWTGPSTAGFGANVKPLADARGSEESQ